MSSPSSCRTLSINVRYDLTIMNSSPSGRFDCTTTEGEVDYVDYKPVTIGRAQGTVNFPANFTVVATMNPCPCGFFGDPTKECMSGLSMVSRYQKRLSGPLLDHIDIHIEVPRVEYEKLTDDRLGEPSESI